MNPFSSAKNPLILEINTWVWLNELTRRYDQSITLQNVPASEWDNLARKRFDYIWLMGVWKRSPGGLQIALQHPDILQECQQALPGFTPADMTGSPYCIKDYIADQMLGGEEGLKTAHNELNARGIRLILDFVPNHVAPDHPWTGTHPGYFIQGTREEAETAPGDYMEVNGTVFARARDPYYPPWPDVLQLNAFSAELRQELISLLSQIASVCDGIRCDMAMLVMNRIFGQTWGERAGAPPVEDFWSKVIPAVKKAYPDFTMIAEVYWDMEWELMQQGFDYCYDKRLYDRLIGDSAFSIRQHLQADITFQQKLVRFIENHDEQRIAAKMEDAKHMAAAIISSTLPGARMYHMGQCSGATTKIPVFLGRAPQEETNLTIASFYEHLKHLTSQSLFHEGDWMLCPVEGWPGNYSSHHLLAWAWSLDQQRALVVVNYSDMPAQGMVKWPWNNDPVEDAHLYDTFKDAVFTRSINDLTEFGLYVELAAWDFHFIMC